jgi:outer membrane protein
MKLRSAILVTAIAVLFYCATAFAQAGGKVGVVNIQKVLIESKSGKEAKATFQKEVDAKQAALASREKTARSMEDDLKASGAKLKADARKAKEDRLADEIKELRRMKQDMEDELRKRDNELTSKILRDVLDIVKKVGDERGYSLVMQLSPQIVYANKSDDITDEVLKRYDSGR